MENALIDVIVPVYKVERTLRKCVNSLLEQSYNNYIITLIDDGSPDNCPDICDELKKENPSKIRVFHKENGGLSDARNYGVIKSISKYIVFVDSDDYVNKHFLKNLIKGISDSDVDIVVAPYIRKDKDGKIKRMKLTLDEGILTKEEALTNLFLEKNFASFAWGKLYNRNLLIKNPFPKGKLFEDSFTIYQYVFNARKIYFSRESDYIYVFNDEGIVNSKLTIRHLDLVLASMDIYNFVIEKKLGNKIKNSAESKLLYSIHYILRRASISSDFKIFYKIIKRNIKELNLKYLYNDLIPIKRRVLYLFMIRFPFVYKSIMRNI